MWTVRASATSWGRVVNMLRAHLQLKLCGVQSSVGSLPQRSSAAFGRLLVHVARRPIQRGRSTRSRCTSKRHDAFVGNMMLWKVLVMVHITKDCRHVDCQRLGRQRIESWFIETCCHFVCRRQQSRDVLPSLFGVLVVFFFPKSHSYQPGHTLTLNHVWLIWKRKQNLKPQCITE